MKKRNILLRKKWVRYNSQNELYLTLFSRSQTIHFIAPRSIITYMFDNLDLYFYVCIIKLLQRMEIN